jgi:hypothetical protein
MKSQLVLVHSCLPAVPALHFKRDRDPSVVLQRSPFLFHTILVSAAYYKIEESMADLETYKKLCLILYEDLGQTLLSPNLTGLSVDLIIALLFNILWKGGFHLLNLSNLD